MNDREEHELRTRLALAEARADMLYEELQAARKQLTQLVDFAAGQKDRVDELLSIVRRRWKPGRDTPGKVTADDDTPPDDDAPPDPGGAGPSVPLAGDAATSGRQPVTRKQRPKGAGRKPPAACLTETRERHDVSACGSCGCTRTLARDVEVTKKIDVVQSYVRVRTIEREVRTCTACHATTTAAMPPMPCERAKFTCAFLAWLVTMKFELLVPLDRIRRHLRSQGVDLPKSTLVRLIELAADLAAPVDGVHWKHLLKRPCLLVDGTGLKVLVRGLPKTWDAYLDVFNADQTVVYQFAMTKHGDELAQVLAKFKGVLLCDGESRLNEICRKEGVRRANCNAHARRMFRDAEIAQPLLAKEGGGFYQELYRVEREAKRLGLVGDALTTWRQTHMRPIVARFRAWLAAVGSTLLPTDLLGRAVRYVNNRIDALMLFVDDGNVPIDNNPSERAFQHHAKLRDAALFAGSLEGGRRWAILLGIVTTAQRHGLDVQAYVTWMFERRGTAKQRFGLRADQLTPAAYKQMLEERKRDALAA